MPITPHELQQIARDFLPKVREVIIRRDEFQDGEEMAEVIAVALAEVLIPHVADPRE